MESATELFAALDDLERLDGLLGFGPAGVVGIAPRVSDHTLPVDDVARRDRQRPARVSVAFGEIDVELEVEFLEIVGKGPTEAVGGRDLESGIAENLETEFPFFDERAALFGYLRRDGDEGGAGRLELTTNLVQSIQLRVAVGSPIATKEGENHRTVHAQRREARGAAVGIDKGEVRRPVTLAEDAVDDAGVSKILGDAVKDLDHRRRRFLLKALSDSIEPCLQ